MTRFDVKVRPHPTDPAPAYRATVYRNGVVLAHYSDPVRSRAELAANERVTLERQREGGRLPLPDPPRDDFTATVDGAAAFERIHYGD